MEEISKKLVTPIGDFNCQSYPLIEGNTYEITDEELEKLGKHELKWSEDAEGHTILIPNDPTEENARNEAITRISELKKYLSDTDYQAVKFAEGELPEADFLETKNKRRSARDKINKLQTRYNIQ